MGGKSGPTMDSTDLVEESASQPSKPSKPVQGGSSSWSGSESGKTMVGNGPDSYQVVFMKDDVSVHPTRIARERISGLLRLTEQGSSLFMTWTPPPIDSGGRRGSTVMRTAEKERDLHAIRSVSLAEMRSIRRHTPPVGLQYIIIVLTSGLSFPPLYFHTGGVKEFFATLRNYALLVRSIDDPSVYFVNDIHPNYDAFQNQEKENEANETEENEKNEEKENEANETEENEKNVEKEKEQEQEKELEQEKEERKLEQEEREIEKKIAEEEAANRVEARRYSFELVYGTQNGSPALVLERAPPPLSRPPPQNHKEGATFLDNEVQVLDPKPVSLPDITYNHPPSSMDDTMGRDTPHGRKRNYRRSPNELPTLPPADNITLKFTTTPDYTTRRDTQPRDARLRDYRPRDIQPRDTQPRKRYRRSPKDLPTLPPAENITLTFTPTFVPRFCPISGRHPRKTVDLVLSPAEKASSIPVDKRYRKTFDLVLSPDANLVDAPPVTPHTTPIFVGSPIVPGQSGSPAPFASAVVEPEVPSLPSTVEEDAAQSLLAGGQDGALSQSQSLGRLSDDAGPSNAPEGVGHLFRLCCSGSFREGVSLPISWRSRLHLAELSSEGGALARRRREWWLGTSLSASVATGIPSHVICLLFTSELFTRLMVDSGLTYKALNALKYIDKFGVLKHVTSGDICQYLKTFFSKAIRNRLRWQRMGVVVVDNAQPLATSMILPYKQRPGVPQQSNVQSLQQQSGAQQQNNVQPPQQQSGVSQENVNREKPCRRWVQRSARKALRKVFEDWGYREITPDETLALAGQFQGNPDAMQIMQLFRNWSQQKRRHDRAAESSSSQSQPTAERGGCRRKRTEAASQAHDAQLPLPHVKKRPVLGEFSGSTSLQSESHPSRMEETAFKVDPRGVLRQVFEDRGCREITLGEAVALSVGFQGNPSATQVQQLFGDWAQDWQNRQALQRKRLLDEAARQAEDARHARQVYLYRKKLPVKKLPIKRLPVVSTVSGCNSLQSESQPSSMKDTTPAPPAVEESRQLITERQALLRLRLLEESARQVEAAQQACGHAMKPIVPLTVSGCSSLQSGSQSTGMEYTPLRPPSLEESRREVQGSSRGGRLQSRPRGVSLPVTQ